RWTPPETKLPTSYISATRVLFEQGLADPRGCRYHEIEIVGGSVWGGKTIHSVHGWVLPKVEGETNEFAVCWNGLVYPLVSTGADANLDTDMAKLMEGGPDPYHRAFTDTESASHARWLQIKACLLLRLGKGALAMQLLAAPNRRDPSAKG